MGARFFIPKKKFKTSLEDRLLKSGQRFEVIKTLATKTIKYGSLQYVISESKIENKYLNLFGQVKKEVKANIKNLELKGYDKRDILYFNYKNIFDVEEGEIIEFKNVVNYDINKAYYTAAKNLGFISGSFYNKCLDLPKKIRLMLIGSIATQKRKTTFENGELKNVEILEDKELRTAWFNICKNVDSCLIDLQNELYNDFIFYWTDGIFYFDSELTDLYVNKIALKYNFEFKKIKIDSFKVARINGLLIYKIEKDKEQKIFYPPNKKKANEIKQELTTFANDREAKETRKSILAAFDILEDTEAPF